MNFSKKHKRHIDYVDTYYWVGEEDTYFTMLMCFYNRRKRNRKAIRMFRKDIRSGAWQKRVYEQTGVRI